MTIREDLRICQEEFDSKKWEDLGLGTRPIDKENERTIPGQLDRVMDGPGKMNVAEIMEG